MYVVNPFREVKSKTKLSTHNRRNLCSNLSRRNCCVSTTWCFPESPPSMGGLPIGTGSLSSTSRAPLCLSLYLKLSRSHCIFIYVHICSFSVPGSLFRSRLVSEISVFDISQVWVWNPREERWVVSDHTDPERMDNWVNFVLRYIQHKVNRWRMFADRARIQDRPFLYLSR